MMDYRITRRLHHTNRPAQSWSLLCTLFIIVFCCSQSVSAKSPVSARYLGISGDTVRLRLVISSPAPQNLILEQYLPPGTRILSASPAAKQVNSSSGVAKWLFKGVSPGKIDVTMRVSPADAAREVSGTLRYRMPGGGGMNELRISP